MIAYCCGDIFESEAAAIVNPVNCVGIMGKGLALEFRKRFPNNFSIYWEVCRRRELDTGQVLIVRERGLDIVNFPTKKHWRDPSRLEYIDAGLQTLLREMLARDIPSVAVPPLGCGLGGLRKKDVLPLLEKHFSIGPMLQAYNF